MRFLPATSLTDISADDSGLIEALALVRSGDAPYKRSLCHQHMHMIRGSFHQDPGGAMAFLVAAVIPKECRRGVLSE